MSLVRALPLFTRSVASSPISREKARRFLTQSRPGLRAFTLVELLVAMTISLLLVVVLLRVFSAATTSWQRGEAQADAYREARGALQIMARDLSTTIQPVTTSLSGTASSAAPLLPTLVLNRYPNGNNETFNEEAYCLSNIINNPGPPPASKIDQGMNSELCAVGFFCEWMPTMATDSAKARTPSAFALMRQFLDSSGVSKRMQVTHGAKVPLTFEQLYARAPLTPGAATTQDPPVATSTQLAAYIWDLKFRIDTTVAATGDGEIAPTDHSLPQPRVYDGRTAPYPNVLPSYVEIRFKALSTTAGRRLEGNTSVSQSDWMPPKTDGQATLAYKQIILPNARQFVLRVPLLSSNPPYPTPTP